MTNILTIRYAQETVQHELNSSSVDWLKTVSQKMLFKKNN